MKEKTLVIVDDDKVSHFIITKMITHLFSTINVRSYHSTVEAMQMVENSHFTADMVFVDIDMPEMCGWDFVQALENHGVNRPVYLLSNSNPYFGRSSIGGYKYVVDFLEKPIPSSALLQIMTLHF